MRKILTAFIFLVGLFSCNNSKPKSDKKILDFGLFTIGTPNNWTKLKENGIDSYAGRIAIGSTDTLEFDLGWYSNTLTEPEPYIVERSQLQYGTFPVDTNEMILVDSRNGIDPDKYRKNNISWDTIDGRTAKIVYPIRTGIGTTGVYIDSLWTSRSYVDRFNLYGENLKPENEAVLLEAIKTLKFHKDK